MNSRQRVFAHLNGQPVDHLPLMPITMQFACNQIGAKYRDYCTDYRVLVRGQIHTAQMFGLDYVNTMSDPAREAADCGAVIKYFDEQPVAIVEDRALLADITQLARLKMPDPLGGGRMHNGIQALALFKEQIGRDKIIEGWVEGPIAEAADLRGINALMTDFFDDPAFVRDLFSFVVEMELRFAREQVKAGRTSLESGTRRLPWSGRPFTRSLYGLMRSNWRTASTLSVRARACTFAGTRVTSSRTWAGWAATSSKWTRRRQWLWPAGKCPGKSSWATSILLS
jgi:hypothetical protein